MTNRLLLIIAIPVIFYILKTLSFIFIPLTMAMFIALLFLPMMRLFNKRKIPKVISISVVILIMIAGLKIGSELIKLSSNEIMSTKGVFFKEMETKLVHLIVNIEEFFGVKRSENTDILKHYIPKDSVINNFGVTLKFLRSTISMILMTIFFVILLLLESINFQKILNNTIFRDKHSSVKSFIKIEKDFIKFIKVKFIISLFTGIGFSLACVFFDISFPIFWGLFAFAINFIQMIGSVISVVLLSLFAFIQLDPSITLLLFILTITAIQGLMGGVIEPVFMGKIFSVNVITVLLMLMFWGYLWGIPGLIMSIPITVFLKIILAKYPQNKVINDLFS